MYNNSQVITNDPSSNGKWMLDHHIMLMVQAKANKDNWKYWVYFDFVLDRMLPYIDAESRMQIDADRREHYKLEFLIKKDPTDSEMTKEKNLEALRLEFIEAHKGYVSLYLPKTGILQVEESGDMNYQKQDLEKLQRVLRAGAEPATITKTVETFEKQEAKKEDKHGTDQPAPGN